MDHQLDRQGSPQCEFCSEVNGESKSRFCQFFNDALVDRTILATAEFVAVPSMGQIVPNSIMLLSRPHVERFADLAPAQLRNAEGIVRQLVDLESHPIAVFEHGARSSTGGSCGIYHAHLHIVPMPAEVSIEGLAAGLDETSGSLLELFASLSLSDEYLLLSDRLRRSWARRIQAGDQKLFPSQYFRRRLSLQAQSPLWDWRRFQQPEESVIAAYHHWRKKLSKFDETRRTA